MQGSLTAPNPPSAARARSTPRHPSGSARTTRARCPATAAAITADGGTRPRLRGHAAPGRTDRSRQMKRMERAWNEVSGAAGVAALAAVESALVFAIVVMTGVGH
ncbi:hypothetical protein BvRS1_03360 [Burkholderia vietnamiensis]|nr:hypothetical protein BvRS1_03360 [Burkholderia vietnamiensis]